MGRSADIPHWSGLPHRPGRRRVVRPVGGPQELAGRAPAHPHQQRAQRDGQARPQPGQLHWLPWHDVFRVRVDRVQREGRGRHAQCGRGGGTRRGRFQVPGGTSRRGLRRGRHERGDDRAHVGHECRANLSRAQGGRQRVRGGSTTRCERRVRRPWGDMRGRRPARGGGGSGASVGGLRRCRSNGAAASRDCALVCRSIGALAAWVVGGGGSRGGIVTNCAAGRERTSCDLQMKLPWVTVCARLSAICLFSVLSLREN
mmetsp:Transcript_29113/g.93857  ORF Transcript_29113/g.93857 Transcript_29113/m.93857 type:complete len:258 (+) Transcript_29113:246-1019(+)